MASTENDNALNPTTEKPHVGIIGAGISGLRCADILLSRGFRVTILEARNRIGGRFAQSDDLGYKVDIGPNWIHTWSSGEVHPIYALAQKTNTPLHVWNNKQQLFDSSGSRIDDATTDRLSTLLWELIEEAFKFSAAAHVDPDDGGKSIPASHSLYDFVKRRAHEVLEGKPDEQRLLLQMSEMWGAYVGEPVWRQSLRFAWMEECCGGEEMFVMSDYSAIFAEIARPALAGADIQLDKRVASISTATTRDDPTSRPTVTLTDGTTRTFDELVMTTPLGWLQRNLSAFTPPLPPRLTTAVTGLTLSHLEKVFITFPRAFWLPTDTTDDPDPFPAYTNWLSPSYATATATNPKAWPQEIWNLAAFRAPHARPTLLFYTYGPCSAHIVSSVADLSPTERHAFLVGFFEPYFSLLPNYTASDPDCVPSATLATEWQRDELSGNASYCNFQVGAEDAAGDVEALREGCGRERRLWFCGEHAAPFEECGTVAGAYLSGEGVGLRIAGLI